MKYENFTPAKLPEVVTACGGQSALAKKFGIPLRTVQGWSLGERTPPAYIAKLIAYACEAEKTIENLSKKP